MKTKLLLIIFAISSSVMIAQTKVADKFFKEYAYVKAAELYLDALDNDREQDNRLHILQRLGDCYYNNSKANNASKYYKEALEMIKSQNAPCDFELIYKYVQTQRSLNNYSEEKIWMEEFKICASNDSRIGSEVTDIKTYEDLKDTSKKYVTIQNLELNTENSDFGGYENGGKMYFASNRENVNAKSNRKYKWNDLPYLDIYEAAYSIDGEAKEFGPSAIINSDDVITNYHEASVAITNDGKTMYLTRDEVNKRNRISYDKAGTSHLMIYKASFTNGNWVVDLEPLPFNDLSSKKSKESKFSTGHPALSPDEKRLYFVSDRKSPGQTDIYYVEINKEEGYTSYGDPVALDAVNTAGREMFPFIAKDSTLYFSSDGYQNLGLLDIYTSDVLKGGNDIKNLGAPYNSNADDFAFYKDVDTKFGYFSSNRKGGKGDDDIYSFLEYDCEQTLKGTITDCDSAEPIAGATVELIDNEGSIVETTTTGNDGSYSLPKPVSCNSKYTIRGSKIDFKANVKEFTTGDVHKDVNIVDLCLESLLDPCEIVIDNIEFDFDKAIVRDSEKYKLENIVDVLRAHPEMTIAIESHTDNRGSYEYNEVLSFCRAKSTRAYLLERGIASERIPIFFGCGEYCKVVSDDEIAQLKTRKDKEAAHQKNRRSVFRILDCAEKDENYKVPSCEECKEGTMEDDECVDCKECARFHD